MKIKRFFAPDMRQAIRLVRDDPGAWRRLKTWIGL